TGQSPCSKAPSSPRECPQKCCGIPALWKPIWVASMLELSGINVHYGKMHVLRDVTLGVETGKVAALIGPNAAGKTTTLRAVVGLKECTSGTIKFGSQTIQRLSTPDRIRIGIALVPEGRQVFTKFSVFENLRLGAFHRADRDYLEADFENVFAL